MDPKIEKLLPVIGEAASSLRSVHAGDRKITVAERFILVAIASLDLAEANDAHNVHHAAGDSEFDSKDIKRLRKLLMRHLIKTEDEEDDALRQRTIDAKEEQAMASIAEQKRLDLGQYAHTKVFQGDERKTEKFAKLMGGSNAAASAAAKGAHSTYAPNSEVVSRITKDIEDQYAAAAAHKGKKGLGSR